MKFFGFIFLLAAIAFLIFRAPVSQGKACYQVSKDALNNLGYMTSVRNWNTESVCEKRTDILLSLSDCLVESTASSRITPYTNSFIQEVIALLRPTEKRVETLIQNHNSDCIEYPKYQIE